MTTTRTTSSPGQVRTRVEIIPPAVSRAIDAEPLLVLAMAYAVAAAGAISGTPLLFAVGAALGLAAELVLSPVTRVAAWVLGEVRLGPLARCLLRGLLALALLARCAGGAGPVSAGVLGWLAVVLLAAAAYGLVELISLQRKAPVLSRGLDLSDVDGPAEPAPWLLDARTHAVVDLPLVVGVLLTSHAGRGLWIWLAALVSVGLALAVTLPLALDVRRLRGSRLRERLPEAIQRRVDELAPDVVLYHAGDPATVYQVESWLGVMEALDRRPLVLLRNPRTLAVLGPTTLPVVCIPASTTLVAFDLASVRTALFVANGAGNIHLLRRTGIGFAFIGHGDSDKASSSMPFARVYDEVWVAGPAGRERYARSGARLAPGSLVEVGRPQLAALQRDPHPRDAGDGGPATLRTVLYAPTWEGWGEDEFHSSLTHGGVLLVQRLIEEPDIRVIYRPHPLTGGRDRTAWRAHEAVLSLLAGSDVHQVAEGRDPGLLWCFEQSDLMIADVSAVVTDWLATGRPYAVLNPSGLDPDALHAASPSTSAGTLIGADLDGLDALLADLRSGTDPYAGARAALAASLLGPLGPESLERFRAAVDALGDRVHGR